MEAGNEVAVYEEFGTPDVFRIEEVEKPVPKDDELLVKVHATSVNAIDIIFRSGASLLLGMTKLMAGITKPKFRTLGFDVSGEVESVGRRVTRFKKGDLIFGAGPAPGAYAEYFCISEKYAAMKPANMTHEEAAAVPDVAGTALTFLRDKARIRDGQSVLIYGASGGVGTYAVQIAKAFGAEVIGVCSGRNADMVRSIGADHVIDYTREDFTRGEQRYDLILDQVANHSLSDCRRVLTPQGIHIPNSGNAGMGYIIKALLTSLLVRRQGSTYIAIPQKEDLAFLKELIEAGKVAPVVDRTYPLSETAEAFRYLNEGHARGKLVIKVGNDTEV